MKMKTLVSAVLIAAATIPAVAGKDDHKPVHGGIVAPGKQMDLELVAKPDSLRLYLQDHGKPLPVGKATAKVTLLNDSEKQDVELKPAGDYLEAKGTFSVKAGTKAVATVIKDGKQSTGRFVLK